ncbi:hypothetical protein GGI25_005921 [Coemansia spiralis]|uniref:Cation/H+ exchanger transmembrane domain-containing protein n=2 Tax=Coemansia TaxID=4863 RepID=A0A9W8KVB0_9FUNG|nr:hypothetical protein EDC05_005942 [Coemansia umbellata]KAJ2619173.1 hypothetical protein GGI26_006047 [Coemansia sp. RSA 1358]KAJ2670201.1 hypothetical protein GGI25_005921 [Coemansia spiralis]
MVSPTKVVPAFLGGFICVYGLVSGFVKERLFLSEALVAMVFGIIIGPQVINIVDPRDFVDTERFTLEFARYVIAIQVMAAGITLPGRYIVRKWRTMAILLGPVMVVMWLVTAGIIHLLFSISFKQALLIASCAAPTDPILANSVVKGRYAEANVPKNVRDALSAESGINDGLGLPFLYFALYLLNESYSTGHAMGKWFYWIWCYNILLSIAIGIVVGYVARKLLRLAESYDLIDKESFLAFSIGLAIFIVGCLQLIHSDDVLCCFIAGHSFTWDDWFREETKDAHFQEVLDGLINVTFFIYFGTIIPWYQFNNHELVIAPWRLIVAAIMVLFLRRMPVVVLLTRLTPAFRNYRQSFFAGWFGPIGVGAIFFAEIVLEEIEAEPQHFHIRSREIIQPIVMFLIFSSVLIHGITIPLMYIGKVVRTRSRSFSTMSLRSMMPSRLSFVNSREPAGIHGVEIPMLPDDVVPQSKRGSRMWGRGSSEGSPTAGSNRGSPADEGKSAAQSGPAAPLDLTRTITIDETPKVARDQMDIHYRIRESHQQYQQHVQSMQFPNALNAPGYSHLQHEDRLPPRPHSAQDIEARRHSVEEVGAPEAAVEAVPSVLAPRKGRASAAASLEGQLQEEPPAKEAETHGELDDGLVLAADEQIASRNATRANTRQTVMSNIEIPETVYLHDDSDAVQAISRHPSIPNLARGSASVHAAAHHREPRRHTAHRNRRSDLPLSVANVRRILRRRSRQQEDMECQYIGNRLNPLGRLQDGELVDYDDPDDNDPEQSFMGNNVDDRFIDYLAVDLGGSIRKLASRLPAIGRRQRHSVGASGRHHEAPDAV